MGLVEGKVAIVTGAGSGIGRAIAEFYVAEGGRVVVADVSDAVGAVAESLGESATATRTNMLDEDSVNQMVSTGTRVFGRIDALFNVVGVCDVFAPIAELSVADFQRIVALNLTTAFLGMKAVLPVMVEAGGGSIVNFSSAGGLAASEGISAYGASKAGVILLTKTAALEYGLKGIRVNAICPGPTRTPMLAGSLDESSPAYEAIIGSIALGRVAEASEVAQAAVLLSSDLASYVTGVALPVDGGRTVSASSRPPSPAVGLPR